MKLVDVKHLPHKAFLPSLEGWPTKAKDTTSPHEVRPTPLTPTQYFKCLGDRLFTLVLEILFCLIKINNKIEVLDMCDYSFLYLAYKDDITFFFKKCFISHRNYDRLFFKLFKIKIKHF